MSENDIVDYLSRADNIRGKIRLIDIRNMARTQYQIFRASRDDLNEGWLWLTDKELREEIEGRRRIGKIEKDEAEAKSAAIYCELLCADELFIRHYKRCINEGLIETPCSTGDTGQKKDLARLSNDDRPTIFISAWYRNLLGIEKSEHFKLRPLKITISKDPWQALYWQFLACFNHPQIGVALGTLLGLIGFFLGIAGAGLGLVALKDLAPLGAWDAA